MISKQDVLDALLTVIDRNSNKNVIELGLVRSVLVNNNIVHCVLNLSDEHQIEQKNMIEKKCRDAINAVPNLKELKVVFITTHNIVNRKNKKMPINKISIPGIKNIILISSGKGGVGKSTIAVNMALSLLRKGYKSAVVDLDIYGPSIPHILGLKKTTNPEVDHNNQMIPITRYGLKSMSIGYLIDKSNAAIWRGPMVTKAVYSLIMNTVWGEIDYLVIDTPPGTGDVHISLVEKFKVTGVVVVSTPQDLAIIDAVKICDMMKKMNVHIIGLVENMSYFINSDSGDKTYIFGKQGVHRIASELNVDFLGEVALYPQICSVMELGDPLALDREICKVYDDITDNVLHSMKNKCIS